MKKDDLSEVKELLSSYVVCKQQKSSEEYAKKYFVERYKPFCGLNDEEICEKMELVENLIFTMPFSRASILLNLHYINGLPVEKCAESMEISRTTAFRILKRAIIAINKKYQRIKGGEAALKNSFKKEEA